MNHLAQNFNHTWLQLVTKRLIHKNHYEVLNLPRDCTSKDIKRSYIELSKKHHPDRSKDPESQKKFVQITEAYQVLSKQESRNKYDLGLPSNKNVNANPVYTNEYPETENVRRTVRNDPHFWVNRDKSKDKYYESRPYYGIQGVKRISNFYVLLLCLGFTCVGVGLQIMAVRHSFTLNRKRMMEVSNSAEENLRRVKEEAQRNGNKLQLELMAARLKKANGKED